MRRCRREIGSRRRCRIQGRAGYRRPVWGRSIGSPPHGLRLRRCGCHIRPPRRCRIHRGTAYRRLVCGRSIGGPPHGFDRGSGCAVLGWRRCGRHIRPPRRCRIHGWIRCRRPVCGPTIDGPPHGFDSGSESTGQGLRRFGRWIGRHRPRRIHSRSRNRAAVGGCTVGALTRRPDRWSGGAGRMPSLRRGTDKGLRRGGAIDRSASARSGEELRVTSKFSGGFRSSLRHRRCGHRCAGGLPRALL